MMSTGSGIMANGEPIPSASVQSMITNQNHLTHFPNTHTNAQDVFYSQFTDGYLNFRIAGLMFHAYADEESNNKSSKNFIFTNVNYLRDLHQS